MAEWIGKRFRDGRQELDAAPLSIFMRYSRILKQRTTGNPKEIAFNDFYLSNGKKFGSVQSFGVLPPTPIVVASMAQDLRDGGMPWAIVPFNLIKPAVIPRYELDVVADHHPRCDHGRLALSGQPSHRQQASRKRARHTDLLSLYASRLRQGEGQGFWATLGAALKPYRFMRINQAENNQRIAHVCGTCRFGLDAGDSVLDANNKAHSLSNLYIVDASFFPSSGGTNPALTIAANALRVAAHLCGVAANQREAMV